MDASSGETNRPWLQRGTRLAEAAMAAHDEKEDFAFRASNGFAVMSEGERRIQTQPHLTARLPLHQGRSKLDRKSTRLNSSHSQISYAVFCLKKKKTNKQDYTEDNTKLI